MEPGLSLNGASMLFSANNSWTEYKPVKPTKPTTTKPSVTYLYGDVNFDKTIDVKDATLIVKVVTGKVSFNDIQIKSADVNGDGEINVKDATLFKNIPLKWFPLSQLVHHLQLINNCYVRLILCITNNI